MKSRVNRRIPVMMRNRIPKKKFLAVTFFYIAALYGVDNKNNNESLKVNSTYEKKIIFQEKWNDYLIFYDNQKHLYYLKFRKDKWDYDNDAIIDQLVLGVEYLVSFEFTGTVNDASELVKKSTDKQASGRDLKRKIRNPQVLYAGIYKSHFQAVNIRY